MAGTDRSIFALLFLIWVATTGAHQPYESSAVARLDHGDLELTVTTSAEIAALLVDASVSEVASSEALHPRLLKAGGELYEIIAAGKRIEPQRVFFTFRGGEAVFSMIYPFGGSDELRFRAAYLSKLPPGYGGSMLVFDETGEIVGRQPLLKRGDSKDTLSVDFPTAAPVPENAPSPGAAPNRVLAAPVAREFPSEFSSRRFVLLIAGIGVVLTPILLGLLRIHKARTRKTPSPCVHPGAS